MRIWRLFVGAKPTNTKGEYVLASWSYVTGYWRWVIFLNRLPRDLGTVNWIGWSGRGWRRSAWVTLPLLIVMLSVQTQPPMPVMKKRHA